MDFSNLLEKGHSKEITSIIVKEILIHPKKMDELMAIFLKGDTILSQRAAWPMSFAIENNPNLINNYYADMIKLLQQPNKHDAINRNILRALQYVDIPKKYQGQLLDVCFRVLNSSKEPVAVKVFCMTVIDNLSKIYPDIIPELKASIEALIPEGSAGIKSRGNKILKKLNSK